MVLDFPTVGERGGVASQKMFEACIKEACRIECANRIQCLFHEPKARLQFEPGCISFSGYIRLHSASQLERFRCSMCCRRHWGPGRAIALSVVTLMGIFEWQRQGETIRDEQNRCDSTQFSSGCEDSFGLVERVLALSASFPELVFN